MLDINTKVQLNNGLQMPLLGFGTWQLEDSKAAYRAVLDALVAGYRHIDTAKFYGNEVSVGKAIRDSGIPREEIWVTTKWLPTDPISIEKAFHGSLKRLNIGYIDLYLVHFPIPGMIKNSWRRLEKIYLQGNVRSIGVSNYSIRQLKSVLKIATVMPTVNQIKCSPFNYDPIMHDFCNANGILMEAYSPLTRGNRLNDERLVEMAKKYNKTPAQILIRWCVQKGIPTIPKSIHEHRIIENADIFDFALEVKDIATLDNFSLSHLPLPWED